MHRTIWPGCSRGVLVVVCLAIVSCTPISQVANSVKAEACEHDGDCPVRSACMTAQCVDGECVEHAESEGTELADDQQVQGDCNLFVCDDRGDARKRPDDADLPSGDGNPCHEVTCEDGKVRSTNVPDSTPCNDTGTCHRGTCDVCAEGRDCSRPDDCTVYRITCSADGAAVCEDTGVPRSNRTCGVDKVCSAGRCVPCVVGDECTTERACYAGRITSCDDGVVCEEIPLSGSSCGTDSQGETQLFCVAGECMRSCRDDPCGTSAEPCMEARWDCSDASKPVCMEVPREDGTSCGADQHCHAGTCVKSVLVNGDFGRGLEGWTTAGDAAQFRIAPDDGNWGLLTLSTSPDGGNGGGAAMGSIAQEFVVPQDALALRFVVSGGHSHIRLKDAAGSALEDCVGLDSGDERVPVSWELAGLRGQRLTLAVEDDEDSGSWAFVATSGFDVIRDIDAPLRNPQFLKNYEGWETEGDGQRFRIVDPYNHYEGLDPVNNAVEMYGRRRIVTTYVTAAADRGSMSQTLAVPADAVALRFHVYGGTGGSVRLVHDGQTLYTITGTGSDVARILANWSLVPFRGQSLRLIIEDDSTSTPWGYITSSGFDVITSYNGP